MPTGVPQAIRDRLSREIAEIVKSPAVSKQLVTYGWDVTILQQAEFGELMKSEYDRYGKIVRARGIKVSR